MTSLADRLMFHLTPVLAEGQREAAAEALRCAYGSDECTGKLPDGDEVLEHLRKVGIEVGVKLSF